MIRTLRRAGMVAAFCLIASTSAGTVSASPQADSVQTFRNLATGGCLDHNDNDGVRDYPCNGGPWQKWEVHRWGDNTRQLKNVATGKCLYYNILGGDTIRAGACNASTLSSWYIQYPRVGGIAFENQYERACLTSDRYMYLSSCNTDARSQSWS